MQSRDFVFWLQGAIELGDMKTMNEEQMKVLKEHLHLVFTHDPEVEKLRHGPVEFKFGEVHGEIDTSKLLIC